MRVLRPLLLLVVAAAVGLAIGLALIDRGEELPPVDVTAEGPPLLQQTSISPRVHLFAEPVTAEAELLVDPGRIVPSSVQLEARFDPYVPVSSERTETSAGDLVRVRYRYRLACTVSACAPTTDKQEINLGSATVTYARREPEGVLGGSATSMRAQDVVGWPSFEVVSRLGPLDVLRPRWRAHLADLPGPSYRVRPGVLGAGLLGSSALLALVAGLLVASQLRRRLSTELAPEERALTALERALSGVVDISANGAGPARRRSLERLARELTVAGRNELAGRARRLAWAPGEASRSEVDALTADVRALVEEER